MRRDPPETRWLKATKEEDGRASRIVAGGNAARDNSVGLNGGLCRHADIDAIRHHAGFDVTPQRDKKLSRHCHDGDSTRASLQGADAFTKPNGKRAPRLIA